MKHTFLTSIAVFLGVFPLGAAEPGASRPDILLLMPDQMRGDCLSGVGHPVLRTPNLDKLAQAGALFRRAYATVPSCIPARYAMLTGLYPQTSGVVGFKSRLITTPTLPALLTTAGYRTVLVGRTMHQDPPNKSVGFEREILGSTYVEDDAYDRYLKAAVPESGGINPLIKNLGVTLNWWQAQPWPLADELHPTAWVTRESSKVVAATPVEQPLFLVTSFYAPHPPLFPPARLFDALMKQDLPQPAHGDWVDWPQLSPAGNPEGDRILLKGDTLRRAQAGYFGLIEQLDAEIAPLVADFKARSEKAGRPWLIVLTSDHGEMLGDHGYFRKCEPYEGADNIPLIIVASTSLGFKPGLLCKQPVCLEDIMPTLLALAGAKQAPSLDGVNLVPTLRGEPQTIRELLHTEHAPTYSAAQAFHALTDGHFKYIWRPVTGAEQLFDLEKDPREEHDLSKLPVVEPWRARMVRELVQRPEGFSDGKILIPGRPYRAVQDGAPNNK